MNLDELLTGIAIVIDDEIDKEDANINRIIDQLKERNIPILKYKSLAEVAVEHLGNISFLILDWELKIDAEDVPNEAGVVKIGSHLQESIISENIVFIKKLTKKTFCPIFIFTNVAIDSIKQRLIDEQLIEGDKPNKIFLKAKNEIENAGQLFVEVEQWLKNTPSVYILKKWDFEYQLAKTAFFNDFQKLSPYWPLIMWKCFKADGVNQSLELTELLSRNVHNRIVPFEFDQEVFNIVMSNPEKGELRKVLEGERYLKSDRLNIGDIGTGDLFKIDDEYLLNIRPQCDLLRKVDIMLYCIKGVVVPTADEDKNFNKKLEQYNETINKSRIPFIDDGKIIDFSFTDIEFKRYNEINDKRIGRLLPPYITRIQQRFALYLQRIGLPRIPIEAINSLAEAQGSSTSQNNG